MRASIATAIGSRPEEIALCNNTTDGINIVADGVDWQPGDEVITCNLEHPSGLLPWFYIRDRFGVSVKIVTVPPDGTGVVEAFEEALSPRTRLVCVSHASWCTGLRLPVAEICAAAHRFGAAVVVDGAQGPGHVATNVKDLGCDFYGLSGQKWLMGPHGAGGLYVSSSALWQPKASHLGWASVSQFDPAGQYQLHSEARRYEYATTNHGVLAGLNEAVRLYLDNGPAAVFERILQLSDRLVVNLESLPDAEIISPRGQGLSTGLVAFRLVGHSSKDVVMRLWQKHRVVSRWVDPEAIRFSIHIFNTEDEIDRVSEMLKDVVS